MTAISPNHASIAVNQPAGSDAQPRSVNSGSDPTPTRGVAEQTPGDSLTTLSEARETDAARACGRCCADLRQLIAPNPCNAAGFKWLPVAVTAQVTKASVLTALGSLWLNGADRAVAADLTRAAAVGSAILGTALALAVEVGLGRQASGFANTLSDWRYLNPLNDVGALLLGQVLLAQLGSGEAPSWAYEPSFEVSIGQTDEGELLISAPESDLQETLVTSATPLMGLCAIALPVVPILFCYLGYSACRDDQASSVLAAQNALSRADAADPVPEVSNMTTSSEVELTPQRSSTMLYEV